MATAVRTEKKLRTTKEQKRNLGRVVQVIGPVLDVEFESEHLPELYNALRIRGKTDAGLDIDVVVEVQQHIGRNQVRAVASSRIDVTDRPTAQNAAEIVDELIQRFASAEIDAVYVVYAKFQSALSTPPATQMILPVTPPQRTGPQPDYILLPSAEVILTQLLPSYVRNSVYRALVETAAGEQGARRTAMKNATDNAGEMLNVLRRTFNRARQAQITQEIAEIVGGASALQG